MRRPSYVYDTHIKFLDNLLRMGWTRMEDARKDIEVFYRITPVESSQLIKYWAHTLRERHAKNES